MYPLFMARGIEALDILGGTDGILGIDSFANRWVEQYIPICVLLVILFGARRLVNTDLGLVLRGVKDNDQAIRASLRSGRPSVHSIDLIVYQDLGHFARTDFPQHFLNLLDAVAAPRVLDAGRFRFP